MTNLAGDIRLAPGSPWQRCKGSNEKGKMSRSLAAARFGDRERLATPQALCRQLGPYRPSATLPGAGAVCGKKVELGHFAGKPALFRTGAVARALTTRKSAGPAKTLSHHPIDVTVPVRPSPDTSTARLATKITNALCGNVSINKENCSCKDNRPIVHIQQPRARRNVKVLPRSKLGCASTLFHQCAPEVQLNQDIEE
jgi:hypothetical protein